MNVIFVMEKLWTLKDDRLCVYTVYVIVKGRVRFCIFVLCMIFMLNDDYFVHCKPVLVNCVIHVPG
jgi:hypothetical protein